MKKLANRSGWRTLIDILVIGLSIFILLPQLNNLLKNSESIGDISLLWLLLAFVVYQLNIIFATASYIFLSIKELSFKRTILIQLATGFTNRVLPSGSGAIAINTLFLKKSGASIEESLSISVVNNILGFIAFIIIMFALGANDSGYINDLTSKTQPWQYFLFFSVLLISAIFITFIKKLRIKAQKSLKNFRVTLKQIIKRPFSALMSLIANCGITLIHVVCLLLCLLSVGYALPISVVAIVFAATIASISASPTPNGLGVTEVIMISALQLYGLPESQALIATLSYRLVTFWLPIIPGFIAYRIALAKKII